MAEESDPATPLSAGRIHCSYRSVVEHGQVLGAIALLHELTEPLRQAGGHIGYGIRPSARGRGLATWALGRVLLEAQAQALGLGRALIVCEIANIASARTIEHRGGVLEDVRDTHWGRMRRYWVTLG